MNAKRTRSHCDDQPLIPVTRPRLGGHPTSGLVPSLAAGDVDGARAAIEQIPYGNDEEVSAAFVAVSRSALPASDRDRLKDLAVARAVRLPAVVAVYADALAEHMNRVGLPLAEQGIDDDAQLPVEVEDHTFSLRGREEVALEDLRFRCVEDACCDDEEEDLSSSEEQSVSDGTASTEEEESNEWVSIKHVSNRRVHAYLCGRVDDALAQVRGVVQGQHAFVRTLVDLVLSAAHDLRARDVVRDGTTRFSSVLVAPAGHGKNLAASCYTRVLHALCLVSHPEPVCVGTEMDGCGGSREALGRLLKANLGRAILFPEAGELARRTSLAAALVKFLDVPAFGARRTRTGDDSGALLGGKVAVIIAGQPHDFRTDVFARAIGTDGRFRRVFALTAYGADELVAIARRKLTVQIADGDVLEVWRAHFAEQERIAEATGDPRHGRTPRFVEELCDMARTLVSVAHRAGLTPQDAADAVERCTRAHVERTALTGNNAPPRANNAASIETLRRGLCAVLAANAAAVSDFCSKRPPINNAGSWVVVDRNGWCGSAGAQDLSFEDAFALAARRVVAGERNDIVAYCPTHASLARPTIAGKKPTNVIIACKAWLMGQVPSPSR